MVKKSKTTENLTMNTATVKADSKKYMVNTSRLVSVPMIYEVEGKRISLMLPPGTRQELPTNAKVITSSQFVKIV